MNKMLGEKAGWELYKDVACCFEQISEAALYSHLPPILQTIQDWQTRHTGHCWKDKDKLISNVLNVDSYIWTH